MSTKEKILEIAEDLFLTKGYDSVSVRDITQAAGANVASVNYHFNCKRDLYREVFKRKLGKLSQEKIQKLEAELGTESTPTLEHVVRSIVSGFLNDFLASQESEKLLSIITNEMSENAIAQDILMEETIFPMHKVLRENIRRAHPALTDQKVTLCISSIFGQIFHFVRARSVIRQTAGQDYDQEFINTIIDHITEFTIRGIRG